ncbi:hypothetical protein [Nonomuraea sp. NPDC050310]|uniref:hypothetical protein n=1 Tax=Nonomuraea sp. NPDC050310 TaxID=3154935 RepID=UPI0033F8F741
MHALARAFSGAGADVVAAAAHRLAARREVAFRRLIDTWLSRGGPALRPRLVNALHDIGGDSHLTEEARALTPAAPPYSRLPAQQDHDLPAEARLRLARYRAGYVERGFERAGSAVVQMARPSAPDEPWRLSGLQIREPSVFGLRTSALHGPGEPRVTVSGERTRSVVLARGGFEASAG